MTTQIPKSKAKRTTYPRFFRNIHGFGDDTLFVRVDGPKRSSLLLANGDVASGHFTLASCLAHVIAGRWREHRLLAKKV